MMTTKVVKSPVYCLSFAFCSLSYLTVSLSYSFTTYYLLYTFSQIAPFHPPLPPTIPSHFVFFLCHPSYHPGTQHKAILIM
ncbi:hypothetical protein CI102_444 [Trichoderma harzianum]|nr:hypothetical protein CI102_444 [Trichoderma harzianum]